MIYIIWIPRSRLQSHKSSFDDVQSGYYLVGELIKGNEVEAKVRNLKNRKAAG